MARRWEDLRAPASGINPPGQVSDPGWDNTELGWLFDPDGTEIVHIIMQLPHGYIENTHVYPHVHWEPTDTGAGDVLWRMEYRWRNNLETGSFTTVDMLATASGTADQLQIDGFGAMGKDGAKVSSLFEVKLSRIGGDASDTYGADARLKEFDVHIQLDDFGSSEERSK